MKKVIFCDMDGTIIDETGLINPKDKIMIEEYRKAGNIFAFNTGRNIEEAKMVIKEYNLDYDYLVLNNGAHITDKNDNTLCKHVIDNSVGIDIINHCLKYDDLWIYFFDGQTTLAYYQGETYQYSSLGKVERIAVDFLKKYSKVKEFDIIAINQDNRQINNILEIKNYIAENFNGLAQGTLNQFYLDITPSNCSKGSGIIDLIKLINEDLISYAIGDSYNDISMFKAADHGYTFNRASDEIKSYSDKQVENLSELIEEII